MTSDDRLELKTRLSMAGLSSQDIGWLSALNWKPNSIPPISSDAEYDAYARRNAVIMGSIGHLTFAEQASAPEAMLGAVLGARLADWRDRGEDSED